MSNSLTANTSIEIHADIEKVWDALIDPETISQYLFGTKTETSWEPGTPIRFSGEYQGTSYLDKGMIKTFDQYRRLQYTYWSSMSGLEDSPENYALVTFELAVKNGATLLTVIQDNIKNEAARQHSEANWTQVLHKIKEILENKPEIVVAVKGVE